MCFVGEQCSGVDNVPILLISFAINDGERVCCNGTFTSWNTDGSPCNRCPSTSMS